MIKSINNWVLIKPEVVEDKTKGGLIIPPQNKRVPRKGVVVSVGENVMFPIIEGDTIHFKRYTQIEVEDNGETLFLVEDKDILAGGDKL